MGKDQRFTANLKNRAIVGQASRGDVPTATVISEYLDVAHAFFDAREAKFVNGVLDAVAKGVRR